MEWKQIPGWPGYEASDEGQVRSASQVLTPQSQPSGHLALMIRRRKLRVHHAVLLAFVGPCPDGMECRHLNDDPTDNRLANLRWGTRTENRADAEANGRIAHGAARPAARLTDEQVQQIRDIHKAGGRTLRSLGAEFGVSHTAIRHIVNATKWRHI